jgi:primosomal protein N' (replication factor Y)
MIAEVIIDIKHHDVNQLYDYFIPNHLTHILEVGMRVWVPFSHQKRTGIVINIKESSNDATKDILEIDTGLPILKYHELEGVQKLVKENHMLYQQAFDLMIPHLFQMKYYYDVLVLQKDDLLETLHMDKVGKRYKLLKRDEIHLSKLKLRHQQGILELTQIAMNHLPKRKTVNYRYTGKSYERLSLKLSALKYDKHYTKETLLDLGFSTSNMKTLIKHGILTQHEDEIQKQQKKKTQEKKTEIDIRILPFETMIQDLKTKIEETTKNKENLLILVPNIHVLTILKDHFMTSLTYDYKSTAKTMLHIMNVFHEGSQILISTRKGIFLPVSFDQIYIVESHSMTYRYDQGVFFDAIETVMNIFPNVQLSLHSYMMSPYLLLLNEKYLKKPFQPHGMKNELHVVSMKNELLEGHTKVLSRDVIHAVKESLKEKHVVMYYPKKGYQTVNVCRLCGDVQRCPTCQEKLKVTSTYEASCITCHQSYPLLDTCQHNHHKMMKPLGLGLEYVAKNIQSIFKDTPVYIIDKEHSKNEYKDQHAIFIGTQKIQSYLQTLDFDLTVIVLADLSFHVMDVLDDERHLFDLVALTPITHQKIKNTWIQTYDPEHIMIKGLMHPESYMNERLIERELLSLPPYTKLFEITIDHPSFFKGYQQTLKMKASLELLNIQVIGPLYEEIQPFKLLVKLFSNQRDIFYEFVTQHHLQTRRIQ